MLVRWLKVETELVGWVGWGSCRWPTARQLLSHRPKYLTEERGLSTKCGPYILFLKCGQCKPCLVHTSKSTYLSTRFFCFKLITCNLHPLFLLSSNQHWHQSLKLIRLSYCFKSVNYLIFRDINKFTCWQMVPSCLLGVWLWQFFFSSVAVLWD